MFAIVFLAAVGILYFTAKEVVSPEQAAADVEDHAKEAEAEAKALVDNAEATAKSFVAQPVGDVMSLVESTSVRAPES